MSAATGALVVLLSAQTAPNAQAPQESTDLKNDARVEWLTKNAVNVRSGDPADEDFRDLAPLRKSIGDSRIVMLGDASHIGGGSFLAMSRLVKFLHRDMGFDVLVFESGLYDMSKVWDSLRAGEPAPAAVRQGLMGTWGQSEEVHSLIDYVAANARTNRPLELAGWDPQVTGAASRDHLIADLGAFASEMEIKNDLLIENGPFRTILENTLAAKYARGLAAPSPAEQKDYLLLLKQLGTDITAKNSGNSNPRARFWEQVLRNLTVVSQMEWAPRDQASQWEANMLRDQQGALNLLWLANERYRGHKIIVWAATWHEFRNKGFAMGPDSTADPSEIRYINSVTMGQHVWETLGSQVYAIGFTAYGGTHGMSRGARSEISPVRQSSHTSVELEELFNAAGFEYAFLDFRSPQKGGEWLSTPIRARYLGDGLGLRNWTKTMDGTFFIREQKPNTEWIVKR
jgi:erythromycin esterase